MFAQGNGESADPKVLLVIVSSGDLFILFT
jgi:hypothetical protein